MELPELLAMGALEDRMKASADRGWELWGRMNTPRFVTLMTEFGVFLLNGQIRNVSLLSMHMVGVLRHYCISLMLHLFEARVRARLRVSLRLRLPCL